MAKYVMFGLAAYGIYGLYCKYAVKQTASTTPGQLAVIQPTDQNGYT